MRLVLILVFSMILTFTNTSSVTISAQPVTGDITTHAIEPDTEGLATHTMEINKREEPTHTMEAENKVTSQSTTAATTKATTAAATTKATTAAVTANAATVKKTTGKLHVEGNRLVNKKGKTVQLRGVSTHGIAWYPQFVNQKLFNELSEVWGANVVRLAMYTAEYNGYCAGGDKEAQKKLIKQGVKYAKNAGLYAIVDWHILSDCNPETNEAEAVKFFDEMSKALSKYTNVIYEICNEPNGGTPWSTIKAYAERVIPVIRKNHPDAVILVGTPNWSQFVEDAAADPITKYDNVMYTLHFYAASHRDDLRDSMVRAYEAGLPIFVSEFGICDASGNGANDKKSANTWIKTLDKLGISYVCWNLANKDESSSMFKASCTKTSGFKKSDMNEEGVWMYNLLRKHAGIK